MKHLMIRSLAAVLALLLCLPLGLTVAHAVGAVLPAAEDDSADDSAYVEPAYLVDFTDPANVAACSGLYQLDTESTKDGMKIVFRNSGNGACEDPYMNLAIPQNADATRYHYFAMVVRTNKQDLHGELRFRTQSTGDYYPCQFFQYQKTDDWQLVVLDITDQSTVNYVDPGVPFTGTFTNLRLDMFHNSCPTDTVYEIRAYGLYETREAAETFIHFQPTGGNTSSGADTGTTGPNPRVNYADFWRGEAYATPALSTRMRWVTYGFNSTATSPIRNFLAQGYGGVVSNVLFEKNYLLNDKQFETLGTVYRYANEHGMSTWIYDEYQWPSGKAFGQVLQGHDEYQATGVQHKILKGKDGHAVYAISGTDIRILRADLTDASGTRTWTAADGLTDARVEMAASGDWTLDVYVLRYTYEGVENPDDFTTLRHVDLLNKGAVARFIEVTHERYKNKMGESFAHVDAFFTDEPQLGNRQMMGYAVWTPGLEDRFKAEYGYDLDIAAIFGGKKPEDMRCRMHYFRLVAKLFKEAYIDQISDWCETNGTASSGHLLFEECMTDQIETYGGDFMQIIGGMTIPGLDLLHVTPERLLSKSHIGSAMGIRYVVSAAKNEGKDRVMVEFNPAAAGALSAENPLLDCIGGASVTRLLGTTDYNVINPQLNLNSEEYLALNMYVGRLNTLLEGARECGALAVFYPIATIQAMYDADTGHTTETNKRSKAFDTDTKYQTLCTELLKAGYLYTVLDDTAICNATVAADGCLCTGNGAYTTVILPFAQYISAEAMEKLVTFRHAGGTVIFVGNTPAYGLTADEDARVTAAMAAMGDAPAYKSGDGSLYSDISGYVDRPMSVKLANGKSSTLLMGDFAVDGREVTYLANTATAAGTYVATYADGYKGNVTVYYPRNGLIETVTVGEGGAKLTIPGYEAVLIVRENQTYMDHLAAHTPYVEAESGTESETDTDTKAETPIESNNATESATEVETPASSGAATGANTKALPGAGCGSAFLGHVALAALACAGVVLKKRKD